MKIIHAKCVRCGSEFNLPPHPGNPWEWPAGIHNINLSGLVLPYHTKEGEAPTEITGSDNFCEGSMLHPFIRLVVEPRFKVGDPVTIARLMDTMTSKELIGHVGVIDEVETLFNGDYNYEMKCKCDGGSHYVHEEELEPAPPETSRSEPGVVHSTENAKEDGRTTEIPTQ